MNKSEDNRLEHAQRLIERTYKSSRKVRVLTIHGYIDEIGSRGEVVEVVGKFLDD